MNSRQARIAAQVNADKIEYAKQEKNRIARAAGIRQEQARRERFYKEFSQACSDGIEYAIKEGLTHCDVTMWEAGSSPVQGEAILEEHGYKDLIKKVENKLKLDGFKVTHGVENLKHTNINDLTGNDTTSYYYHAYVRISW